ncbi:hypothetical protein [Cylindrospermopsis raciborskii]|uniref:hypothetical protein n=1 Tax=Cylindrospermopsis raciborskii TaxID=77022 RepID=UPI003570F869
MTRLTYIEFDLEQILNGEKFAEFGLFYRLFHRSRLPETADDADKCWLEYYHQESLQQGGRVRDRLRDGVEKALVHLGNGFLQHRDSENLRQKLSNNYELRSRSVSEGNITNYELIYYRQLLRLIYRLLFLMVAESRNLLLVGEDAEKARIHLKYYSIERLRELAEHPRYRREGFQDIWQGLRVTFKLFDEDWRGKILGLSPLNGGLFGSQTLTDLDDCGIDNYDLLTAIRCLSLYEDKGQLRRVNYAALDVEELGSLYESLLDFHPQVNNSQGIYEFNLVFGSDRKTTGSYYTPPQLVQQLIKTALEPVIEEKLRELRVVSRESGRFPLTAVGDINTYAVFAETMRRLINSNGRVGVIVPTGIATDDTCKRFFGDLIQKQNLASLYDFENREKLFTAVDSRMKFSLLAMTSQAIKRGNFAFFLTQPKQLENQTRLFQLAPQDIALINPNTLTCPVFRTSKDAELTKKIYQNVPVLENEKTGINPWNFSFMRMFDMANDSGLFHTQDPGLIEEVPDLKVPLYEAKMFHQFDHRWATYTDNGDTRDLTDDEKSDLSFTIKPRYWVDKKEVENKLSGRWDKNWLLGFRDITNSTNERTAIFSLLPKVAVNHKAPLVFLKQNKPQFYCLFLANVNSLVFDFVTRQKLGGTSFSFFIVKQLPVIPPERYTEKDIEYIAPRVLELVYTSWDMQPFVLDLQLPNFDSQLPPFIWNPNRRALIRAELDAYYAKLYGLTRDELRYILDPADVYGADFPSETFRVLKNNEIKQYGEYRTQRLVLEAWDRIIRNS